MLGGFGDKGDSLRELNQLIDKRVKQYIDRDLYGSHIKFRGLDQRNVKPSGTAGEVLTTVAAGNGELYSQWEDVNTLVTQVEPSLVQYYLTSTATNIAAGTVINSASYGWTEGITNGSTSYVSWDSTNRRPVAEAAGIYRVSAQLIGLLDTVSQSKSAVGFTLLKNGATQIVFQYHEVYETTARSSYARFSPFASKIVECAENDYFTLRFEADYGSTAPNCVGGSQNTWIELEYLGPIA